MEPDDDEEEAAPKTFRDARDDETEFPLARSHVKTEHGSTGEHCKQQRDFARRSGSELFKEHICFGSM